MAKSKRSKTRTAAKSTARKTSKARKPAVKTAAKAKSAKGKAAKAVAAKSRRVTTARASKAARGNVAANPTRAASTRPAKPARMPQRVAVSHYNNADFESGLRAYAQYRDLGIVDATDGMVRAHVLRFTEPCDPAVVSKLHFHDTEFQMVYVLKGWVKTELEGQGEIIMRQGSAWTQPPKIKHKINDYSEDAELLEIILPADFGTEELPA
ncbi:MAG: cupin [Rhizobiales bacterium 62-47]|nr:cupin domain-containing protein [Hyphomicrobiales bacterium]OJY09785.1 MAG: cupin [Rhizobiales bacterium 62-47]